MGVTVAAEGLMAMYGLLFGPDRPKPETVIVPPDLLDSMPRTAPGASTMTRMRRASYGGRKGRSAARRLEHEPGHLRLRDYRLERARGPEIDDLGALYGVQR